MIGRREWVLESMVKGMRWCDIEVWKNYFAATQQVTCGGLIACNWLQAIHRQQVTGAAVRWQYPMRPIVRLECALKPQELRLYF